MENLSVVIGNVIVSSLQLFASYVKTKCKCSVCVPPHFMITIIGNFLSFHYCFCFVFLTVIILFNQSFASFSILLRPYFLPSFLIRCEILGWAISYHSLEPFCFYHHLLLLLNIWTKYNWSSGSINWWIINTNIEWEIK